MKFPIFTVVAIMMTGLFFFTYIMVNYGFHNSEYGVFTELDEQIDVSMGPEYAGWARDILDFGHSAWGTGFVCLIVVTIACIVVDVLKSKEGSLE